MKMSKIYNDAIADMMNHVIYNVDVSKRNIVDWCVGRCRQADVQKMLFSIRNVDKFNGTWAYRAITDEDSAKMAIKELKRLGMSSCGTESGDTVYSYFREEQTKEGRIVLLEKIIW